MVSRQYLLPLLGIRGPGISWNTAHPSCHLALPTSSSNPFLEALFQSQSLQWLGTGSASLAGWVAPPGKAVT